MVCMHVNQVENTVDIRRQISRYDCLHAEEDHLYSRGH